MEALKELALLAELKGDRRAKTLQSGVWAIRSFEDDLRTAVEEGTLIATRGIGKTVAGVASDVLDGLPPAIRKELAEGIPPGLLDIAKIRGLGPKKVKALFEELGIESLGELEYACRENRLVSLSGFGPKTQEKVLGEILRMRREAHLMRRDIAEEKLAPVLRALEVANVRFERIDDLLCGKDVVSSLSILVAEEAKLPEALLTLAQENDLSIRAVPASRLGYESIAATASEAHLEALIECGAKDAAAKSAEELYRQLGFLPSPPERRHFVLPVKMGKARPELVSLVSLKGAFHNHTIASDGSGTLDQMAAAANSIGLAYLGISDHSESAHYARGLEEERLRRQRDEIHARDAGGASLLLAGTEADILLDGGIDFDDELLLSLDFVVASIHQRGAVTREKTTARLVQAAKHPAVDMIGHPTGRLLLARAPMEMDFEAVLRACAEHGTALELNANPARLDLDHAMLVQAKEAGVKISIAADAHAPGELRNLEHGISVARRAGLTTEDVLNTLGVGEFRRWRSQRM